MIIPRCGSFYNVQLSNCPLQVFTIIATDYEKKDPSKARVGLLVLLHCYFSLVLAKNSQPTAWRLVQVNLNILKTKLLALALVC